MKKSDDTLVIYNTSDDQLNVRPSSGMLSLIEALNPLGHIGQAIKDILLYKFATKQLTLEHEKIRLAKNLTEKTFELSLARLEFHRQAMLHKTELIKVALDNSRLSQEEWRTTLRVATEQLAKANGNVEVIRAIGAIMQISANTLVTLHDPRIVLAPLYQLNDELRQELLSIPEQHYLPPQS